MSIALLLLASPACGVFFGVDFGQGHARERDERDAYEGSDADVDHAEDRVDPGVDAGATCPLDSPFGAPRLVAHAGTDFVEDGAWLTSRGMFFGQQRGPTSVLQFASLEADGGFDAPRAAPLTGLSEAYAPSLSRSELVLYVTGSAGSGVPGIYRATRTVASNLAFSAALVVAGQSSDHGANVTADALWFARVIPGNRFDVFRAPIVDDGPPGEAISVDSLNTAYDEFGARLTGDGRQVFFATDRPGGTYDNGKWDVWTATRGDAGDTFTAARPVVELNSAAGDRPTWVSPDGCRILLQSNRRIVNGIANEDIFIAERSP